MSNGKLIGYSYFAEMIKNSFLFFRKERKIDANNNNNLQSDSNLKESVKITTEEAKALEERKNKEKKEEEEEPTKEMSMSNTGWWRECVREDHFEEVMKIYNVPLYMKSIAKEEFDERQFSKFISRASDFKTGHLKYVISFFGYKEAHERKELQTLLEGSSLWIKDIAMDDSSDLNNPDISGRVSCIIAPPSNTDLNLSDISIAAVSKIVEPSSQEIVLPIQKKRKERDGEEEKQQQRNEGVINPNKEAKGVFQVVSSSIKRLRRTTMK